MAFDSVRAELRLTASVAPEAMLIAPAPSEPVVEPAPSCRVPPLTVVVPV